MALATCELSPDQIREALAALEQAIYHHEQWLEAIGATMVCRLPPDARDVDADSHRKCRFGQWYYSVGGATLGRHPGFLAVEQEHKRMHELAAALLRNTAQGDAAISLRDYSNFEQAAKRMRLEIAALKAELGEILLNLDPLTGAMNRGGMLMKLREQQAFVRRDIVSCAIVIADLDHFKTINDTHGHVTGDHVLIACARYMRGQIRPYDRLYRYGGEEFLLCTPNTDRKTAYRVAERLRKGIAALSFDGSDRNAFRVTASFGLSMLDSDVPVEQSIDQADKALYCAKSSGRNRTAVWDPGMREGCAADSGGTNERPALGA